MKFLKFNFSHPFKGKASLVHLNKVLSINEVILIDNDGLLEIPIGTCQSGKWKLILEWQHNDNSFYFQQDFEVQKRLS
ncbi:hypothetical protein [Mucilaginibacter antarcticus]|uniref:Uncharacterized protein n=1 Tax=Mucilaginibacter antarcticus TaxID=1855725 RepID=A0ABW5XU68_9SPHI